LRTQLTRYETQLADWCHCPSGETPEGKRKIADLQHKADAIRAELKQQQDARTPPARTVTTAETRLDVYA
jgi:hypothetical protein